MTLTFLYPHQGTPGSARKDNAKGVEAWTSEIQAILKTLEKLDAPRIEDIVVTCVVIHKFLRKTVVN